MRAVILSGRLATSLGDETGICPEPMFEVDGRPIIWHILNICSQTGINEVSTRPGVEAFSIMDCIVRSIAGHTGNVRGTLVSYGIRGENSEQLG